jgi:hypothetical protein
MDGNEKQKRWKTLFKKWMGMNKSGWMKISF